MFTDERDIERELRAALQEQPSAGFEAAVGRAIEADRSVRPRAIPPWLAAAAALLLAAGGWYLANRPEIAPLEEGGRVATPGVPRPERVPPVVDYPVPRTADRATVRAPRLRQGSGGQADRPIVPQAQSAQATPEVIVPPGQLRAIERLVREVNAGRLIPPDAPQAPAMPAELVVPPVPVEPISVVTVEPRGGTQPGPKGLQ